MPIQVVGVVGAGTIGVGVAQNLAETGHRVILLDVSMDILDHAMRRLRNNSRMHRLLRQDRTLPSSDALLAQIRFSIDYSLLELADFVIENVPENWDVKKVAYRQLDEVCPEHCVFAANTSAIPLTRIASATRRAHKVIGMHFMNPVPLKPTVEVIRGFHTSDETIATATSLLAAMGKDWIIVNDSPGFVSNRVLMLTINEAIFLLHEGVATAEQVDSVFKSCIGHKMGPLETADLIGLDTILYSIEVLYQSFNDSKYRPCPLLKRMVDAGLHGQKTGRGFYTY